VGAGGVFQEDLGGGVSTATTAMWTAAFFAGMERVHTQAHSIWISRYQAGLEATVAWGFFDMQFRNDTPHGVLITTRMTPTSITVSLWGTKVYDRIRDVSGPRTGVVPYKTVYDPSAACHAQSGVDGFSIVVTRVFVTDHEVVKREPIRTRYVPSPQVICGKDPSKKREKPKPDPTASAGPSASPGARSPSPGPS
jgi:vancomycin resistance protein YoaR